MARTFHKRTFHPSAYCNALHWTDGAVTDDDDDGGDDDDDDDDEDDDDDDGNDDDEDESESTTERITGALRNRAIDRVRDIIATPASISRLDSERKFLIIFEK